MEPDILKPLSATGDDDVLTAPEVATYLRVSVEGVRRLHRSGRLRALPGRHLRFSAATVKNHIHGR